MMPVTKVPNKRTECLILKRYHNFIHETIIPVILNTKCYFYQKHLTNCLYFRNIEKTQPKYHMELIERLGWIGKCDFELPVCIKKALIYRSYLWHCIIKIKETNMADRIFIFGLHVILFLDTRNSHVHPSDLMLFYVKLLFLQKVTVFRPRIFQIVKDHYKNRMLNIVISVIDEI